jgi:hypothetical protein
VTLSTSFLSAIIFAYHNTLQYKVICHIIQRFDKKIKRESAGGTGLERAFGVEVPHEGATPLAVHCPRHWFTFRLKDWQALVSRRCVYFTSVCEALRHAIFSLWCPIAPHLNSAG